MSTTTTPLLTADQPSHALANITAHPGSSYAGAGILVTLATFISQNPLPTSALGWLGYAAAAVTAVLAALGK